MARGKDVVAIGVDYLRERIAWLSEALTSGSVKFGRIETGKVFPGSRVNARIRNLQPWTVRWSNVPDYIAPSDFHRCAREVGTAEDTLHFFYSMNWRRDVKNAWVLDLPTTEARKEILDAGKNVVGRVSAPRDPVATSKTRPSTKR